MAHLGPVELGILLLVVVMIFGVGKLPELGAGLGKSIRGFRRAVAGEDEPARKVQAEPDDKATI
jgi:sec-independent protein translocase protein TatA